MKIMKNDERLFVINKIWVKLDIGALLIKFLKTTNDFYNYRDQIYSISCKSKVSSNLLSLHERKIDEFDKEIEEEANSK